MENVPRLEVHYHLANGLHSLDAIVRNCCEAEFLAAASYIVQSLGAKLQFEATIPTEGGFRDVWRVLFSADNRPVTVPAATAILGSLVTAVVTIWVAAPTPNPELEKQQLDINRLTIEHLRIENLRSELEVKKLQRELNSTPMASNPPTVPAPPTTTPIFSSSPSSSSLQLPPLFAAPAGGEPKRLSLQMDPKVNKPRSNFYKHLISYERVTAVGFRWLPDDQHQTEERIVDRAEFANFLLQTDTLEPEVTEAIIEIVSPVITEGDIQWKGRWNGQSISFAMDDKAYKDAVFHKQVSFQHGDSIRCVLKTERKLDEFGNPKVKGHHVVTVLDKIESGGKMYETPQGRRKRFDAKHAGGQRDLFSGKDV